MLIRIAIPACKGESPVDAWCDGKPVQVGHVTHKADHYYRAVLWERAGKRQTAAGPERVVVRSTLGQVRQALRDRVRLQGK